MMFFNSDTELSVLTDESSDTDCLVSISDIYMIIESLPNDQRTVFNLFEIEGYSHSEIAVKLRISVNNSKVILHRAKKRIQVIMLKDESYESR
jgi:RNA polymerase sigma-70 factor (ECF subfamily)